MEQIKTLEFNPLIRELVIIYMNLEYQEYSSHLTEHEIFNEYNHLLVTNNLDLLRQAEHLCSEERLKKEFLQKDN